MRPFFLYNHFICADIIISVMAFYSNIYNNFSIYFRTER